MLFSKVDANNELKKWTNKLVKTCTMCGGTGSIMIERTNKASFCECQKKALLNSYLICSGVPVKYLDDKWGWNTINCNLESIKKTKKYVDNFFVNYDGGKWLYIYGKQGIGKTMLETLSAKDIAKKLNPHTNKKFSIVFIVFEDMIKMSHDQRNDYVARKKYNEIIEDIDILIMDNIGSETGGNEYNTKTLEYILRKRDMGSKPTILSSNFTPEQLKQQYSDTVYDFVMQNSDLVLVEGDNYRQKTNAIDSILVEDFFKDDNL